MSSQDQQSTDQEKSPVRPLFHLIIAPTEPSTVSYSLVPSGLCASASLALFIFLSNRNGSADGPSDAGWCALVALVLAFLSIVATVCENIRLRQKFQTRQVTFVIKFYKFAGVLLGLACAALVLSFVLFMW